MDKVKLALKFLKKQHFWFLLGLVVIVCGYSWYSACGALTTAFQKYNSEIEERKTKARNVSGIANHPNLDHHKREDELIAARTTDVAKAWRTNFEKQGDSILTWPAELPPAFVDLVKDLRPIEPKLRDPKFREVPTRYLESYRNYIQNELPKLAEIVGAKWAPGSTGGSVEVSRGPGPTNPGVDTKVYLVEWLPADQEQWKTGHFDWSKKSTQVPTTREVLYAQEDLWVLKALLTIIKKVNGNIDQPHLSTIKTIDFIHIGRDAATTQGIVQRLKPSEATAGMGGEGARPGGSGPPGVNAPVTGLPPTGPGPALGGREGMSGMGPGGPGATGENQADNRYVDDKYQPLTAAQLMAIGQTNDEADAHLAVAKRIPIRVRVQMDTRRVHRLLSECANSPLTVEVRQLRVNPEKSTKGGSSSGSSRGGIEVGGSGGAASTPGKTFSPYDGTVEIYGIIYIYNPVPDALAQAMNEAIAAAGGEVAKPDAAGTAPAATTAPAGAAPPAVAPATGAKGAETAAPAAEAAKTGAPAASAPAANGNTTTPATPAAGKPEEKPADTLSDDLKAPAGAAPAAAPVGAAPAPAKN